MDRIARTSSFATVMVLCAPSPAQAPATPLDRLLTRAIDAVHQDLARTTELWSDHSTWDNAWVAKTDHVELRTTHSYGEALDLAQGLEAMLTNINQTLGADFVPPERLPVFVFPDIGTYNTFGNQNGQHHSSFYGSFYAAALPQHPVAAVWHDNPTWLRMQLTHSFVHQYLGAAYPRRTIPTWLDEGLAAHFAAWWDYGWTLDQFEALKAEGQVPHLRTLMRDGIERYGNDTGARMTTLGMAFYWLLRFREDTRTESADKAPFRDYVTALLQGRPVEQLPFHALTQDPDALEQALLAFEFPR